MSLIGKNLSFGYNKKNLLFKNVNICINSNDILGYKDLVVLEKLLWEKF